MNLFNTLNILTEMQLSDTSSVDNVADLLMKGGFIMIPIILLSLISIYFFLERYSYIRKNAVVDENLVNDVIDEIKKNKAEQALSRIKTDNTSMGRILESGLDQKVNSHGEPEKYMESSANFEISVMEKNTGYLGIIASIAPMLGFVGTIAGVIKIFYNISLADNISIGIIAGGLYQKMICSAAGLIVGVIAYAAYHYLQMKIDNFSIEMQKQVNEVIKVL